MTWTASLTEEEIALIREAMVAVVEGPWLRGEFHSRTGFRPEEVRAVIAGWPEVDGLEDAMEIVRSALREIVYAIRFTPESWARWFSADEARFEALALRVRTLTRGD